jgi:uncharacterized protein (TIGR03032 family)
VIDPAKSSAEAFGSVHTRSFPPLLQQLKSSLLVTTFQARMLIVVSSDGEALRTEFVALKRPMGIAADSKRIVVGGRDRVYEFRNMPTLTAGPAALDAPRGHDAVYLMRNVHITGGIDVHEMALAGDECWCVNTRFSCLCTLDQTHSFVPRWRPPFITSYAPEDRCHLNGLALQNGHPKFVTALGEGNASRGWRANKRNGGILLDVDSGETVVRGLSMPHSPRLHRDRLWLLESGKGDLATVDVASGKVETVVRLPGFTRGLDFFGPLAFVGLSRVRASNTFVDIPLTDENPDRASGIWVVNIETGKAVAFLRFSGSVEEVFAVHLLRGAAYPQICAEEDVELECAWVLPDAAMSEVELAAPKPVVAAIQGAR